MKFTDGHWQLLPGVTVLRPAGVESVEQAERRRVDLIRGDRLVRSSTERSIGIITDGSGRWFVTGFSCAPFGPGGTN